MTLIFSEMQLANIFPNVAIASVRRQMNIFKNHFIPTAEAIQNLVDVWSALFIWSSPHTYVLEEQWGIILQQNEKN